MSIEFDNKLMTYESAIFDLDGTLLESSGYDLSWLYNAVNDVLDEKDCKEDLTDSEIEILAGLQSKKEFVAKCESLNLEPEAFWNSLTRARAKRKLNFIDNGGLTLYDGAVELLEYLKQNNIRIGLISNSPDTSVDAIVRYYGLDKYLHYYRGVTDLEDLGREKPDPWHIEIALEEIKRRPCVYIGDSKIDINAAENAGITGVKVDKNSDLTELKNRIA